MERDCDFGRIFVTHITEFATLWSWTSVSSYSGDKYHAFLYVILEKNLQMIEYTGLVSRDMTEADKSDGLSRISVSFFYVTAKRALPLFSLSLFLSSSKYGSDDILWEEYPFFRDILLWSLLLFSYSLLYYHVCVCVWISSKTVSSNHRDASMDLAKFVTRRYKKWREVSKEEVEEEGSPHNLSSQDLTSFPHYFHIQRWYETMERFILSPLKMVLTWQYDRNIKIAHQNIGERWR